MRSLTGNLHKFRKEKIYHWRQDLFLIKAAEMQVDNIVVGRGRVVQVGVAEVRLETERDYQ